MEPTAHCANYKVLFLIIHRFRRAFACNLCSAHISTFAGYEELRKRKTAVRVVEQCEHIIASLDARIAGLFIMAVLHKKYAKFNNDVSSLISILSIAHHTVCLLLRRDSARHVLRILKIQFYFLQIQTKSYSDLFLLGNAHLFHPNVKPIITRNLPKCLWKMHERSGECFSVGHHRRRWAAMMASAATSSSSAAAAASNRGRWSTIGACWWCTEYTQVVLPAVGLRAGLWCGDCIAWGSFKKVSTKKRKNIHKPRDGLRIEVYNCHSE